MSVYVEFFEKYLKFAKLNASKWPWWSPPIWKVCDLWRIWNVTCDRHFGNNMTTENSEPNNVAKATVYFHGIYRLEVVIAHCQAIFSSSQPK
jgi:hypothetical protein